PVEQLLVFDLVVAFEVDRGEPLFSGFMRRSMRACAHERGRRNKCGADDQVAWRVHDSAPHPQDRYPRNYLKQRRTRVAIAHVAVALPRGARSSPERAEARLTGSECSTVARALAARAQQAQRDGCMSSRSCAAFLRSVATRVGIATIASS